MAVGRFSQFASLVTDSSKVPVTYDRYAASLWLKGVSTHGSYMLVAPYRVDLNAFEISRDMAPYAYLKEYFLDDSLSSYNRFNGYIPFVNEFYDQYRNDTEVRIVYSNGQTQIGFRP